MRTERLFLCAIWDVPSAHQHHPSAMCNLGRPFCTSFLHIFRVFAGDREGKKFGIGRRSRLECVRKQVERKTKWLYPR